MCCNIRTHVVIISIISHILTVLAALEIIKTFHVHFSPEVRKQDILIFSFTIGLTVKLKCVVYGILSVSETLCLLGAIKKTKCFLIPFIICMALQILSVIVCIKHFAYLAEHVPEYVKLFEKNHVDGDYYQANVILLRIRQIMAIYFLGITIKYVAGNEQSEELVLRPYTSHGNWWAQSLELASMKDNQSGTQNEMNDHQKQPPSYEKAKQGNIYAKNLFDSLCELKALETEMKRI